MQEYRFLFCIAVKDIVVKYMIRLLASMIILFSGANAYVSYEQADSTFEKKINEYFDTVRNQAPTAKEITQLLASLACCNELTAADTLQYYIKQIYYADTTTVPDHIRVGALVKIGASVAEQMKKTLLGIIDILEMSKQYWEVQKEHSLAYAAVYPFKWVTNSRNRDVAQKLHAATTCLDEQLTNLGSLLVHLDLFDKEEAMQEHCAWVQQLCALITSMYPKAKIIPKAPSIEAVCTMLIKASKCTMHYAAAINSTIESSIMPSSVRKNWASLFASVATTYYGLVFGLLEREQVKQYTGRGGASVGNYMKSQYTVAKEVLFNSEITAEELRKNEKKLNDEFTKVLTNLCNRWDEQGVSNQSNQKEKKVTHPLVAKLDKTKLHEFNLETILKVANDQSLNTKVKYLEQVVIPLISDLKGLEVKDLAFCIQTIGKELPKADCNVGSYLPGGSTLNSIKKMYYGEDGAIKIDALKPLFGEATEKFASCADTVFEYGDVLLRLNVGVEKAQFKRGMWDLSVVKLAVLTMPAVLVLWLGGKGLFKIYKKIKGAIVYDSVRAALADIGMLLNFYGDAQSAAMVRRDYGKLRYLVYKLELEQKNVPKEFRASFIHDVKLLKSTALNAAQKLHTIDLMFKRYASFLMNDSRYSQAA